MKTLLAIGSVCLALAAPGNASAASVEDVVRANNEFGFNLSRQIKAASAEKSGNRLVSPISAFMALSLTDNGARGETDVAIRKAMAASGIDRTRLNQANRQLLDALNHRQEVSLALANSVWTRTGFPLEASFKREVAATYDAEARELDFSQPDAAKTINDWVSEKTHERIRELVKSPIEEDFILLNATYFKGSWSRPFPEGWTAAESFSTPSGPQPVPTMHQTLTAKYLKQAGYEVVEMNYGTLSEARLLLFVPDSLDELERGLTGAAVEDISRKLAEPSQMYQVKLSLPKFRFEAQSDLKQPLTDLGMGIAFSGGDFFDLTRAPIVLTKAIQKTYINLDEKGTEAAAVTEIGGTTSIPSYPTVEVKADHPFLILIQDTETQAILFLGAVNDPRV